MYASFDGNTMTPKMYVGPNWNDGDLFVVFFLSNTLILFLPQMLSRYINIYMCVWCSLNLCIRKVLSSINMEVIVESRWFTFIVVVVNIWILKKIILYKKSYTVKLSFCIIYIYIHTRVYMQLWMIKWVTQKQVMLLKLYHIL